MAKHTHDFLVETYFGHRDEKTYVIANELYEKLSTVPHTLPTRNEQVSKIITEWLHCVPVNYSTELRMQINEEFVVNYAENKKFIEQLWNNCKLDLSEDLEEDHKGDLEDLEEYLEEDHKVDDLEETITDLKERLERLERTISHLEQKHADLKEKRRDTQLKELVKLIKKECETIFGKYCFDIEENDGMIFIELGDYDVHLTSTDKRHVDMLWCDGNLHATFTRGNEDKQISSNSSFYKKCAKLHKYMEEYSRLFNNM